jgi:N-acetylglucosamine malate deacetylase 1
LENPTYSGCKEKNMSTQVAFAVAAHPDDIEFMMAGTLLMLGRAGYELHTMNLCNGSCGTAIEDREAIVARRTIEAREAARTLGATFHAPLVDDIDLFYERDALHRLVSVMRDVKPTILLVASPQDYMEDHTNACRVAVTAAFCRGMRNCPCDPPRPPIADDVTLYHALPWGLRDSLRRAVRAGQYVDIAPGLATKRAALACHKSQKEWLDASQGIDSYLTLMEEMSREVGRISGAFEYAEGWRRHLHLGFCAENADPLAEALGDRVVVSREYEENLK